MSTYRKIVKEYLQQFKIQYWNDPVWSKVISAAIIAISSSILTAFYLLVKSLINQISFRQAVTQLLFFLKGNTSINNFILVISILFILSVLTWFSVRFLKIVSSRSRRMQQNFKKEPPFVTLESNVLFDYRLASAFPGQRGLRWYNDPKIAVERLLILLQEPLTFRSEVSEYSPTPFWWFRDMSSMYIEEFKALSKTKVLMNREELSIKRVAVNVDANYKRSFIYVETGGEKQTGINNYTNEDIKRHVESFGYSWEEFALLNNHVISRAEYDDGAAIINSKVIEASNAKSRVRYLTDYNFIITSHDSPYNSKKFELNSGKYLNDILISHEPPERFFEFLETFTRNEGKD